MKRDVDRRAFLQGYFTALVADAQEDIKANVADALEALSEEPTVAEIDHIYSLVAGGEPADKWDGKVLTFTNVQQNGTERILYINNDNKLDITTSTAEEVGAVAQFRCKKEASGKYSFFNEEKEQYMIWRAGNNYGYNNNSGTLAAYNATYCDWSINAGSVADRYYLVSKRNDGTTDGSLIVMASGVFDAYSAAEGYTANYSNLFRIDVVGIATGIDEITDNRVQSTGVYDLTGRKIDTVTKAGIYIVNGKKRLVK